MDIVDRCNEFSELVRRNDGAADHVETASVLSDAKDEIVLLRLERAGLAARAEAFRTAVVLSGALCHVEQDTYFTTMRRLEAAISAVRSCG